MFTYLTNRQINQINSGKEIESIIADFMNKFTARQLASDLVELLAEKEKGKVEKKITITPEDKAFLDSILNVQEKVELPVIPPFKERKPRKKVEYTKEELEYKKALMTMVIFPCRGKSEAEKNAIKKKAEPILKPLREKAEKAKIERNRK